LDQCHLEEHESEPETREVGPCRELVWDRPPYRAADRQRGEERNGGEDGDHYEQRHEEALAEPLLTHGHLPRGRRLERSPEGYEVPEERRIVGHGADVERIAVVPATQRVRREDD